MESSYKFTHDYCRPLEGSLGCKFLGIVVNNSFVMNLLQVVDYFLYLVIRNLEGFLVCRVHSFILT